MTFERAAPKWPWRDFLTEAEKAEIQAADDAKVRWQELNKRRAMITNRAIHRAKHHAQKEKG